MTVVPVNFQPIGTDELTQREYDFLHRLVRRRHPHSVLEVIRETMPDDVFEEFTKCLREQVQLARITHKNGEHPR